MSRRFDGAYWEAHWADVRSGGALPPHPSLPVELADVPIGTALDAGAGEGAEAVWLAEHGWTVTAVDVSAHAIEHAEKRPGSHEVSWITADLTTWEPAASFDLVTTFYAHPDIPQHAFYRRIAGWVAPGGTLLIVGHGGSHGDGHGRAHPENTIADAERIRALLDPSEWTVQTAQSRTRTVRTGTGHEMTLNDVVTRARRR
jgi:SAM-dependent methyltransferase